MRIITLKKILTLVYSGIISAVLYLISYLVSQKIKFNMKETFFLVGLVLVLSGIVMLLAKNPARFNGLSSRQKKVQENDIREGCIQEREEEEDDESDENANSAKKSFLLGFNSFTIALSGVILLAVDATLK